ncbi:E-selectin-like [Styela clava]
MASMYFLSLGLLFCCINRGSGLRCWTCNDARSEKQCIARGQSEKCRGQAMSCQTEIRYHEGAGSIPFITKRCKQTDACENNRGQNPGAAAGPTQCNSGVQNSVCRCCCRGFHCNRRDFWCSENKGTGPTPKKCKVLNAPENGSKQCKFRTLEGDIGTRCTFSCEAGYHLNGNSESVCRRGARGTKPKFNNDPPDCEEMPEITAGGDNPEDLHDCDDAPAEPENGGRSCLRNSAGVSCRYFCGDRESLVGDGIVTCTRKGGWDGPTPECKPRCSKLQENFRNGNRVCDGEDNVGSTCEYSCNPGFEMIGSATSKCVQRGKKAIWSPRAPTCTTSLPLVASCEDLGTLEHGEILCDGETNKIGTICEISCVDRGFALRPSNHTEIECLANGWSAEKPCCSRLCPPFAQVDVVIIMDSSSSVRKQGWGKMLSFVKEVIGSFTVSDASARFSVFRFNSKVDVDSQILFGAFPNNKTNLLHAVEEIPYNGRGTYIGRALTHARDTVLKTDNRENIKDMVWVLTDGISKDEVAKVSTDLRDFGAEVFALGISHPKGKLSEEQLLSIGGDEEHVIITEDGINSLSGELVERVAESICDHSCI